MIRSKEWTGDVQEAPDVEGDLSAELSQAQLRTLEWTDPETGQRLMVRLHGSARFLQALKPLGFAQLESLASDRDDDIQSRVGSSRAWVSVKAHLNPEDRLR